MNNVFFDKILGCLVGGAAGDALGYPIEFNNVKSILKEFGEQGIQEYVLSDGKALISDDTQMTLFTAAGLLLESLEKEIGIQIHPQGRANTAIPVFKD